MHGADVVPQKTSCVAHVEPKADKKKQLPKEDFGVYMFEKSFV